MIVKVFFTDLETELLDSVGAKPCDLISWVDKSMPSIVRAFYKEALKKKEVFTNETKNEKKKKKIH